MEANASIVYGIYLDMEDLHKVFPKMEEGQKKVPVYNRRTGEQEGEEWEEGESFTMINGVQCVYHDEISDALSGLSDLEVMVHHTDGETHGFAIGFHLCDGLSAEDIRMGLNMVDNFNFAKMLPGLDLEKKTWETYQNVD